MAELTGDIDELCRTGQLVSPVPVLRIIFDVEESACRGYAAGLSKNAPGDFAVELAPAMIGKDRLPIAAIVGDNCPDLFFVLDAASVCGVRHELDARGWDVPLVGAVNSGWAERSPDILRVYRSSDALLISDREYWRKLGPIPNTFTIPYGVDHELFHVSVPRMERNQKVIWVGSQDGPIADGYDGFIAPLRERMNAQGIDFEARFVESYGHGGFISEQMAEWYNSATVIVCASESEGAPNPPLEAAACGCTIVSTAVSNMTELIEDDLNGYLVDGTLDAIEHGVVKAIENYDRLSERLLGDMKPWLWERRAPEFFDIFRNVIIDKGRSVAEPINSRPVDLSNEVTVFVTTVGAPTYRECIERVAVQDSVFRLVIIENVAPLTDALQHMLDSCETPYFVQLDEDMLLYPDSIQELYKKISATDEKVAIYVGNLFDVHLGRTIQGIKICRRDIVRNYPWTRETTVFSRNRAIQDDGYRIESGRYDAATPDAEGTFGLHGTEWTPQLAYERYFTLRKWRNVWQHLDWIDDHETQFLTRCLEDQNEDNFFSLMGLIAGALVGAKSSVRQKDFRNYDNLPGYARIRQLYIDLRAATAVSGSDSAKARDESPDIGARARMSDGLSGRPIAATSDEVDDAPHRA
ncbi:MAG: glycosyltransferase family 4 protein [Alphaproteobacteria bacterium]|nr:glycosyltransferase family 4 protein [Alphaproteobacteria bacterium]